MAGYERREVWIPCSGARCHGLLYLPRDRPRGGLPWLVMAMGFGMVKEAHSDDYAPFFAERGIAVLAFDYRRWGRSEGEPRNALYPEDQVADYLCAVSYVKSQPWADPGRGCVWGTSLSGGHVLRILAAPPAGVRCGISQVPSVYAYESALRFFGGLDPVMMLAEQGLPDCCGGRPRYIPIVSRDGVSALRSREAVEYFLGEVARRVPWWENRVTLDSIPRVILYAPGHLTHLITRPIYAVVAMRDETTPPGPALEALSRARGPVTIRRVDAGHFDIYREPLLSEIAREEAEWASRVLEG